MKISAEKDSEVDMHDEFCSARDKPSRYFFQVVCISLMNGSGRMGESFLQPKYQALAIAESMMGDLIVLLWHGKTCSEFL